MTTSSIPVRHVRRAAAPACLRPAVLTLALACALPALAQQAEPVLLAQNLHAPSLRETVVTATRSEQPLSDLVADVSIVDRATIENSAATGLVDVLARLPGVEITRNGGVGNNANVFLRGAEGRFTAVYIDGVRVDSQSTGGALWEQIPLSQIDRIEVLRGPAAAVYGSDAIGGVIQLFTRKGEGAAQPFVGVGVGNHGTRKVEAGISGASGAFDYSLGVAHERSKGYDIRSRDAKANPDRDGYQNTSGNARVGFKLNARHRLDATLLASYMNSGYDAFGYSALTQNDDRNKNRLRTAGLSWNAQWSYAYSTRLSVTDSLSRYETEPSLYRTETRLRGYVWQNEYRLDVHRLSATLERREDALNNPTFDSFNQTIDRDRSQNALALGYGLNAGAHTLQLNVRRDDDSEFGAKNTGSAAYGFAFAPHWRVTASAGTAFRVPTLYQRFSQYGTADLQPETSRNVELGLRYAQAASSFSAVMYRNRVNNLISYDGKCRAGAGCYVNTARAEYRGVTLAGSHKLGSVQVHGSVDFQKPRDLNTDKLLARRAKRYATLGADTQVAGWTMGAEVQASGQRFDNATNTKTLGGYGLVSLYASKRMAHDYTLLARIDNLADKDYQLAGTYVPPGRTLYVGVKWAPQR